MKHFYLIPVLALAAMAAFAQQATFLNVEDLKWGDAPPSLPKGAKIAVLYGDPSKEGPFVFRARFPVGYAIPPHFHSRDEDITVLSGQLNIGMNDIVDNPSAQAVNARGFHHLPAKAHHYAFTQKPTVVQISGDGPFDINYLNAADDPRTRK